MYSESALTLENPEKKHELGILNSEHCMDHVHRSTDLTIEKKLRSALLSRSEIAI